MKKLFFLILSTIFLWAPVVGLAQGGLGAISNDTGLGTNTNLIELVGKVINILLGFLGVIVLVGIIYGGFRVMTSGGNEEQAGQGRKIVAAGLIGLVIIIASFAIASFVITNLQTATGANF